MGEPRRALALCVHTVCTPRAHCLHTACTLAQVPLAWSCVFVAVNAAAASAIAADWWPGSLTPEERELHQLHFNKLTPGEFKQLLGLAERRTLPHGQELTRESVPCDQLYYIVHGRCKLFLRSAYAADIDAGGFVNDVAFQQGDGAGAYGTILVASPEGCVALVWRSEEVEAHLATRPVMRSHLDHVLVATLVKGLMKQREVAHQRAGGEGSWAARAGLPGAGGAADSPPQRPRLRMSVSMMRIDEDPDHPLHPPPHTPLVEPGTEPRPPPRPPARPG